jgi:hypothetical protein
VPDNPDKKPDDAEAEALARDLHDQIARVRSRVQAAKVKLSRGIAPPPAPLAKDDDKPK